jgi:hypothetical protein
LTGLLLALLLAAPPVRGLAVAPHFEPGRDPEVMKARVDEIADLGSTHVSVVVQWSQNDTRSVEIAPFRYGTVDDDVRRVIREARARGMGVMVFPILRLVFRGQGEWRGTLQPTDREAWWRGYRRFILHYADLAAEEHADILSVGSELVSMEADVDRWRALIADVRARFPGRLTYSANWDHFRLVPFWDLLDYVGVNAYNELTNDNAAGEGDLAQAWRRIRDDVVSWARPLGRKLLFTEVGYPSLDGGACYPWDYTRKADFDGEEQRRAYAAFESAWDGVPELGGVFFWIWAGDGGQGDTGYTPRGKPAADVLRAWFGGHPGPR